MKYSILTFAFLGIYTLHTSTQLTLTNKGLIRPDQPLKLHLGCGEKYLPGYINIDFPVDEQTIQSNPVADFHQNIISLSFSKNSIDEIRSHHVFEHFERQISLALLCQWHQWLKVDGQLVIETPDFEECVKVFLNQNTSYKVKQALLRHLFGSHEASWALHYDGWYKDKFTHVLNTLGFEVISIEQTQYLDLHNITVTATKKKNLPLFYLKAQAGIILRDSMVISVPSEENMWRYWCSKLEEVMESTSIK